MTTATADAFAQALAARAAEAEAALEVLLPHEAGNGGRVAAAMRYAALGGGKRLRAFLTLEAAAVCGGDLGRAARAAASIECAHAYSLVHDDLPAMDDDDLRRGQPTAHRAFDEATAILAGDALQTTAFEILLSPETHPDAGVRCALALELARAIGADGMVGGQMIDIQAEARSPEAKAAALADPETALAHVAHLQALKTGRLIVLATRAGGLIAQAAPGALSALSRYADRLGLAFQIADDLLDVEGSERAAGKRLGKDAAAGKATFVEVLGVEGARAAAAERVSEAKSALAPFGDAATFLRGAADFVVARSR